MSYCGMQANSIAATHADAFKTTKKNRGAVMIKQLWKYMTWSRADDKPLPPV